MSDLRIYEDTKYRGFHKVYTIKEKIMEYEQLSDKVAEELDDDEIVLYAIVQSVPGTEMILGIDFMCLRMPFDRYLEMYSHLADGCRMLFKTRKRKEQNKEEKNEG